MILPFTLLKFTNGFRKMGDGEILEVIGTNPDTRKDILKVLATLPCEVLCVHKGKDHYLIRLRKMDAERTQKRGKGNDSRPVQEFTM
jgi:TusA-related sulfurtransferase